MDADILHSWVNSCLVLLTLAFSIYSANRGNLRRHERELAEIRIKVETMWNFLLRRGAVEGIKEGLLTLNSPLRLAGKSSEIFVHLADELQQFYREKAPALSEKELSLAIEREFGSRLVHEICIPNGISLGVCLLIATAVAKGEHTLTEILDEQLPGYRSPGGELEGGALT